MRKANGLEKPFYVFSLAHTAIGGMLRPVFRTWATPANVNRLKGRDTGCYRTMTQWIETAQPWAIGNIPVGDDSEGGTEELPIEKMICFLRRVG